MDDPELCPFYLQISAALVATSVCPKISWREGLQGAPEPSLFMRWPGTAFLSPSPPIPKCPSHLSQAQELGLVNLFKLCLMAESCVLSWGEVSEHSHTPKGKQSPLNPGRPQAPSPFTQLPWNATGGQPVLRPKLP